MDSSDDKDKNTQKPSEQKAMRDFFATSCLQAAVMLQKALGLDEENYLHIAGHAFADSRSYYLYGVLDEVIKASISIRRWDEFLGDPEKEKEGHQKKDDHITRVVTESVIDEQHLWVRKLSEILCDMILFSTANEQAHYRLFLACKQLDAYIGLQGDFKEFFGCESFNVKTTIILLFDIIERLSPSIDLNREWFLKSKIDRKKPPAPGFIFSSARKRYKLALEAGTPDQRITLGASYENVHGVSSRSIHPNIGGPIREVTLDEVRTNLFRVGMLAQHICVMGFKLAGVKPSGVAAQLEEALSGASTASIHLDSVYGKDLDVGDIVFAYGLDLCQVTEKVKTKYGYTSYKVRYLSPPLLPEVPEDWFPARYVHLVWGKKKIRTYLVDLFRKNGAPTDIIKKIEGISEEELINYMAGFITELRNAGVLGHFIASMVKKKD